MTFWASGWAFPVGVDARGRIGPGTPRGQDVEQAILMILLTPKGQRVMRPEFGCQIHDSVFAVINDATTAGLAAYYVEEALKMWEPRITVLRVARSRPRSRPVGAGLMVRISSKTRSEKPKTSNDQRSLVFPFFTGSPASKGDSLCYAAPRTQLDDRHFQDIVDRPNL